jgi:hypothetical protein
MSSRLVIPARVVQLGTVLDCVVEHRGVLVTINEWRGWLLVCDEHAFDSGPGRARVVLLEPTDKGEPVEPTDRGAAAYEKWHKREHARGFELGGLPDSVDYLLGRCLRIGYSSDKWGRRGERVEYEHDFTEGGKLAPRMYIDSEQLERARAALITGGDMRVTAAGLD